MARAISQTSNKITRVGWFLYDQKAKMVCIHRRDHEADESPNTWDCFGGNIKAGEEPKEALIRELFEELQITVEENEVIPVYKKDNQTMYCILFPIWKTPAIRLGEGAGFAWLPFDPKERLNIKELKLNNLHKEVIKALRKFQNVLDRDP